MYTYWQVMRRTAIALPVVLFVGANLIQLLVSDWRLERLLPLLLGVLIVTIATMSMVLLATLPLAKRTVTKRRLFFVLAGMSSLAGWTLIGAVVSMIRASWSWFGGYPFFAGLISVILTVIVMLLLPAPERIRTDRGEEERNRPR